MSATAEEQPGFRRALGLLTVVLLLGGCASGPPSSGAPDRRAPAAAAPQAEAARAAAAAAAALTDSLMRAELTRALAAKPALDRIDTIVVARPQRELLFGDELDLRTFDFEARDSTGATLPAFSPIFVFAPSTAITPVSRTVVRGVAPGRAILYLEALPRDSLRPWRPSGPSTRIEIVVRPR